MNIFEFAPEIETKTGNNISSHEAMIRQTEAVVESSLGHLAEHITRVEVRIKATGANWNRTRKHKKRERT
jgi:hypothetical protein